MVLTFALKYLAFRGTNVPRNLEKTFTFFSVLHEKDFFKAIIIIGGATMKEWKALTLTDDYLFSQIMKDEEFCKLFLEMLVGIKI